MSIKIVLFLLISLNIFSINSQKNPHFVKKNEEFDKKNELFEENLPFFLEKNLSIKFHMELRRINRVFYWLLLQKQV